MKQYKEQTWCGIAKWSFSSSIVNELCSISYLHQIVQKGEVTRNGAISGGGKEETDTQVFISKTNRISKLWVKGKNKLFSSALQLFVSRIVISLCVHIYINKHLRTLFLSDIHAAIKNKKIQNYFLGLFFFSKNLCHDFNIFCMS